MVAKKQSDKSEKASSSWIGEIEKYSRQIWLAGLGAYSKISKDGSKLFDTLVADGEKAEKLMDEKVDAVKSKARSATSRVSKVKGLALGKWEELEEAFDKRLNSAISRLGVPSRNEVRELHDKVEELTRKIEQLTGQSAKATKSAAAKTVKPAAKAAAKAAGKATAKPAAKAAAAAKPVAKAAKPAAKPAAKKAASKASAKPATTPASAPAEVPLPAAEGPLETPNSPATSS